MMPLRQALGTAAALVTIAVVGNSRLLAETGNGCGPFLIGQCSYFYQDGSSHHNFLFPGVCMDGCHINNQAGLCNVHNSAVGCYF